MKLPDFLHVDMNSHKFNAGQKSLGCALSKYGCHQSGHGTLKLTVSQEWIGCLLHAGANSGKLKVALMIFGWVWSKMGMAN